MIWIVYPWSIAIDWRKGLTVWEVNEMCDVIDTKFGMR